MPLSAAEANAYLAAIISSSDDAVISKDLNGVVTSWNGSAERIFGYSADEAIGKHISLIIPPENLTEEDHIISKLKAGERIDHFETVRRRKDGTSVPVSITVSPIRLDGKVIGASKVARDISERIIANNIISEAGRKKDEFLTNMSHELRTPMNAVIGIAFLLSASRTLAERDKKLIETLKISADNLMELINDLLDFSKIDNNLLELEKVHFKLTDIVAKATNVASMKANEKDLKLHVKYSPILNRQYIGDPLRINQIITNLLSNAIKFTDHGSVNIQLEGLLDKKADTTMLIIKVSDTGIGVPHDKLDVIFEKFVQADASVTRRFGGSGLGLTITKALVEGMNGKISARSEVGIGSTFTVTIPLKNTDISIASEEIAAIDTKENGQKHINILLVEDYKPNILVSTIMLDQMGYTFDVAETGKEAIRKFQQHKYDMILMDVQMPEMDGLETTRLIRAQESEQELERTPVVAMTAHVREQDRERCMNAGMDDFIPKPFDPTDLFEKASRFIGAANKSMAVNS